VELAGDGTTLIRLGRVCGPQAAQRVAQWLLVRIGSHFSRRPRIGIGPNVLVARMAARTADGGGIVMLDAARYREVVGRRRVRELPGVTAPIARRLHARGVFTIAQLATADPERLGLGVAGRVLCRRARGEEPIATADRLLVDVAVDTQAVRTARRAPALRVSEGAFEGESARAVERLVTGTLGARIRARLMREGRGGDWMVLPVSGLRRSA
jgi:nucleotidyltransferase/DNA polymerase involved in DNA repair